MAKCCCAKPNRTPIAKLNAIYSVGGDLTDILLSVNWRDNYNGRPCACTTVRKVKWQFFVNDVLSFTLGFQRLNQSFPIGTGSTYEHIHIDSAQDITDYLTGQGVTIGSGDEIRIGIVASNCGGLTGVSTDDPTYTVDIDLMAVFAGWDDSPITIDASTSVGTYIKVKITRGLTTIYESPYETNTGNNTFDISSVEDDLENGDMMCVVVSNETTFDVIDEDCRYIPTPGVTSTQLMPDLTFSFEGAPGVVTFEAPSTDGDEFLTMQFFFFDTLGNEGNITMYGTKDSFIAINDANAWPVIPTTGSNTINTVAGDVTVNRSFDVGFDINLNTHVRGIITDDYGISSVEDYYGITAAIFSSNSVYITTTDPDEVITYLPVPPYTP